MWEETEDAETSSGISCDDARLITTFGLGAAKLFGWKSEEVIGKQNMVIFHQPRAVATLVPRFLKAAAETGGFEEEVTPVRKGVSKFLGLFTARPLMKRGKVVGYMDLTRHLRNA
jgi:PAS domain-containing protein